MRSTHSADMNCTRLDRTPALAGRPKGPAEYLTSLDRAAIILMLAWPIEACDRD